MRRFMMRYGFVTIVIAAHLALTSVLCGDDYKVVKQMFREERFDEAVQFLEKLADGAKSDAGQYQWLKMAIDHVVGRKEYDRGMVLAKKIRDPNYRDFATLTILSRSRKHDEVIQLVKTENIEAWPTRCQAEAYTALGDAFRAKADDANALTCYAKAIDSPGGDVLSRGWAAHHSAYIYLGQKNRAKAKEMFRKGLAISPAGYAWRNRCLIALSKLLIENGEPKEAIALFNRDFDKTSIPYWKGLLLNAYAEALAADNQKIKAAETWDAAMRVEGVSSHWKKTIEKKLDKLADSM